MTHELDPELLAAITEFVSASTVLVASDFDGVIAPLVSRPQDAAPLPDSMAALEAMAADNSVVVALISGRDLATLRVLSGASSNIAAVGSHGSEFDGDFLTTLVGAKTILLQQVTDDLRAIAAALPGATVETKPASAALHVRNAAAADAERGLVAARGGPATRPGVYTTEGKSVIELAVIDASKGAALTKLRPPGAPAIYFGDDVTDEKAFAVLGPGDIGVKVGPGPSAATFRVDDPAAVSGVLQTLERLLHRH